MCRTALGARSIRSLEIEEEHGYMLTQISLLDKAHYAV